MTRVLIVEDSPTARSLLVYILSKERDIAIVGTASNGAQAVEKIKWYRPDVILMDYEMPIMNGFEATRRIMEIYPVPIIIISSLLNPEEVTNSFKAIDSGAVAVMNKPPGLTHHLHKKLAKELIETVKTMSEVKVIRRRNNDKTNNKWFNSKIFRSPVQSDAINIVAIGASTGGPPAIQQLLRQLDDFPIPIVIVQHIAMGFIEGFADWLQKSCSLHIEIAKDNSQLLPNHVYLAPDGFHLGVKRIGRAMLSNASLENGLRPSVSFLFRSVASVYKKHAVGILLTGMGKDGAKELKLMRDKGAITIAQDEKTSVVWGMPGEAVKLGAAQQILAIDGIAEMLRRIARSRSNANGNANPLRILSSQIANSCEVSE